MSGWLINLHQLPIFDPLLPQFCLSSIFDGPLSTTDSWAFALIGIFSIIRSYLNPLLPSVAYMQLSANILF